MDLHPKRWLLIAAWFAVIFLNIPSLSFASEVRVKKTSNGWKLLVDGIPYFVKGMCYTPVKVGESAYDATWREWMIVDDDDDHRNDFAYQSYVDKNGNGERDKDEPEVGDFQLMKEMGVNTIRIYHHPSADQEIQALYINPDHRAYYNHVPNKALLRELFQTYGIRVAMGDLLGAYTVGSGIDSDQKTDYRDPEQRKNMLLSVENMIREFKDEPYILMWILGNENTNTSGTNNNSAQEPRAYGEFVNQVARRIHELDPHHPVCLGEFDGAHLNNFAPYIPDIDIIGVNSYRYMGFGPMWNVLERTFSKPVLITEYGVSIPKMKEGKLDEDFHAEVYLRGAQDIAAHAAGGTKHPYSSIGGFVFEWLDNWWQDGDPWHPNMGTNWNHEICGIATQGTGQHSPYERRLRKAYFSLQEFWTKSKKSPSQK